MNSMNDPRRLNLPYRSSPPNRRGAATAYDLSRQQQRAAQYSAYDGYEYDYDTMPAGGSRSRRPNDNTPRSHPQGYPDGFDVPPPQRRSSLSTQQQQPKLFFGQAAAQLHTALVECKGFYESFLVGFETDCGGVKVYASPRSLEQLWQDKIKADVTPPMMDGMGQHQQPPPINFKIVSQRLGQALQQACNSRPGRPRPAGPPGIPLGHGPADDDASSLMRLVKKLQNQYEDIANLIMGAKKSSRATADLIKEINLLLQVLDGTRNLWGKGGGECGVNSGNYPGSGWDDGSC